MLLNTCLTVEAHKANSHANKGWETFTESVINIVSAYGGASFNKTGVSKGIVFMAWGAPAAKRLTKVDKVIVSISYGNAHTYTKHLYRKNTWSLVVP